jgi:hypothetical protein
MQVPDGWKSGKFYQFVEKIYGGGTPSRDQPKYWNGTIPWVTVKDLTSQKIHGAQEYITVEGLKESASNIVPAGTVIIATRMAVGKSGISTCDGVFGCGFDHVGDKGIISFGFRWQATMKAFIGIITCFIMSPFI